MLAFKIFFSTRYIFLVICAMCAPLALYCFVTDREQVCFVPAGNTGPGPECRFYS